MMPSSLDVERAADAPDSAADEGRRWYDLGFTFTPRAALVLLGLLAAGVAFSFALDWVISRFVHVDEQQIVGWIEDVGILGPIAYTLLLALSIIVSPLPTVIVDVAGGLAFGTFLGTIYTLGGAMMGATANFYIARWLGRSWVERRLGATATAQVDGMADRMGAKLIFVTRLIPLFNFDWVSYAAGLTRISYRSYAIASVLGMALPVIAIVYVGDVKLTHPGRSSLVFTGLVVWSALPLVAFLGWFGFQSLWRRLRSGAASDSTKAAADEGEA